jgi:hypothetical protein
MRSEPSVLSPRPTVVVVITVVESADDCCGIDVRLTGLLAIDQRFVEPGHGPDRLRALKQFADEHSLCAAWFEPAAFDGLQLRTPFVRRMMNLAAQRPALLPLGSVGVMTADERQREHTRSPRPGS